MKPEFIHRLSGRDVLRYRRNRFDDLITRMISITASGLVVTFILLLAMGI